LAADVPGTAGASSVAITEAQASGSFLKKRTKKLLFVDATPIDQRARQREKVFASFFKKKSLLPGIALTAFLAAAATALRLLPGLGHFSPLIIAIILGVLFHNLIGSPAAAMPGIGFTLRSLLRAGVVLLGLQLTLQNLVAVGAAGLGVIAATLCITFVATKLLGRALGVEHRLAELIAAGTAVCGASAIIATNTVTEGSDEDVAYAVASVTIFGTAAMFLYPLLPAVLHLSPRDFGLWAGASIHEVAQVVAASFQAGQQAGAFGTVAKLARVAMLAPLVLLLALRPRPATQGDRKKMQFPWFVLGFVALILVNSFVDIPQPARDVLKPATAWLLTMALAAMGLCTDLRRLRARGLRPLALAASAWAIVALTSLALVKAFT
jgi:uncharacterized integral membrane protein (TIGR00698 family)